ncbi:nuclear transport factor 2 family protein [Variovorax sp. W2I14]|uniref:nuclear transport factor 2 family protein n=1 Tax=Variovorax sp. W2I14 TaxID=3042290 RepID=UPI003D1A2C99
MSGSSAPAQDATPIVGRSFTPTTNTAMTPEQNKRAVTEAWKAFASRDAGRIRAAFTDDAEWLAPKDNATGVALGFTDHMIGPDTIVRFLFEEFPKLFVADVSVDFTHLLCDGDTVVLEMRLQATLANGRHYDNDYCFILELRDGRIARMREYMDTQKGRRIVIGDLPADLRAAGPALAVPA